MRRPCAFRGGRSCRLPAMPPSFAAVVPDRVPPAGRPAVHAGASGGGGPHRTSARSSRTTMRFRSGGQTRQTLSAATVPLPPAAGAPASPPVASGPYILRRPSPPTACAAPCIRVRAKVRAVAHPVWRERRDGGRAESGIGRPPHGTALSAAKPFRHGRGLTPSGRSCRLPASPLPPYPMRARSRSPDKPVSLRALQAPALCRRPPHGASRLAGTQGRGCAESGIGRPPAWHGRTGRRSYTSRRAALRSGLRQSPRGRELSGPGNIRPAKGLARGVCAAPDCPQPRADTCHSPAAMRPLNPSGGSFLSRRNVNPSR